MIYIETDKKMIITKSTRSVSADSMLNEPNFRFMHAEI